MTKREKLNATLEEALVELKALDSYISNQLDDIHEYPDDELEYCKDFCFEIAEKIHALRAEYMDDDDVCMEIAKEESNK